MTKKQAEKCVLLAAECCRWWSEDRGRYGNTFNFLSAAVSSAYGVDILDAFDAITNSARLGFFFCEEVEYYVAHDLGSYYGNTRSNGYAFAVKKEDICASCRKDLSKGLTSRTLDGTWRYCQCEPDRELELAVSNLKSCMSENAIRKIRRRKK